MASNPKWPRKTKVIGVSISMAAYARFMQIPPGDRSKRVSKFLERIDIDADWRDPGERQLPASEIEALEAADAKARSEYHAKRAENAKVRASKVGNPMGRPKKSTTDFVPNSTIVVSKSENRDELATTVPLDVNSKSATKPQEVSNVEPRSVGAEPQSHEIAPTARVAEGLGRPTEMGPTERAYLEAMGELEAQNDAPERNEE